MHSCFYKQPLITSTKMVVKWLIICSVLTFFILEGTNASSMWLKGFMSDMKRSRAQFESGQREFERQAARFGRDYERDSKQYEREQRQYEREQRQYEREQRQYEREQKEYEREQKEYQKEYERDQKKYAREQKKYELDRLRRELFDKGPEDCKLIDNFKNKKLYGRPSYSTSVKVKETNKYKTYKCKDEPRYEVPFYKLVTMSDVFAVDGSFSMTGQRSVKYIGEDKEDFDWEPDMSKYEQKKKNRSHCTDRKAKKHRQKRRSDNEENKKPRKEKRKETEDSTVFINNFNNDGQRVGRSISNINGDRHSPTIYM